MVIGLTLVFIESCSKDDDINKNETVINLDAETVQNDFDKYLYETFVKPYNIEVKYKWDYKESNMGYALLPANYKNSIRMANLIKYLCLDAYEAVAPKGFLKKYFPKMFMFVGSPAFNSNYTMMLGTAEGGLKITLYNLNSLNTNNIYDLNRYYFRTIYHEFSHILHQTTDYSIDFDKISAKDYKSDSWNEAWGWWKNALKAGFISEYASKNPDEDFVELIAHYVTHTEETWGYQMGYAGEEGSKIIERKISIIKKYLKNIWQIDLDALRKEIQDRAAKLNEQDFDNITINKKK